MILKKQLILVVILLCTSAYSQMPIHKIEKDCKKNIIYQLEDTKSNIKLIDSLDLIDKLNNEKSIKDFIVKHKNKINTYITSLNIVTIKRGYLNFNRLKKSAYEPDLLLNKFVNNLSFESFTNMDKVQKYKIGIFMYYNFQDSMYGIEFVELKEGKYYLIYRVPMVMM